LTSLSVEIEGHALGGGMLKLEPSEAENVLLATGHGRIAPLMAELDRLVRAGRVADSGWLRMTSYDCARAPWHSSSGAMPGAKAHEPA